MSDSLRAVVALVGLSFRVAPGLATVRFVLGIVNEVAWPLVPLALKLLTDGIVARDPRTAMVGAVLFAGLGVVADGLGWSGMALYWSMQERIGRELDRRIMAVELAIPGIGHHERPDMQDTLHLLREQRSYLADLPDAAAGVVRFVVYSATIFTLLGRLHPVLLALPIAAIPSVAISGWALQRVNRIEESTTPRRRLTMALFDLATSASAGKELRVFGVRRELVERHRRGWAEATRVVDRAQAASAGVQAIGAAVFGAAYAGAIAFVAVRASAGRATPGDVVLVVGLGTQVNNLMRGVVSMTTFLQWTLRAGRRYVWLLDHAREVRLPDATLPPPERIRDGIAFEGVSFRYPDAQDDVLRDVTLRIPAGSTVAIVGENGAGKSTLVKLLCRFYEPTAGRITVDGVPLARIEPAAWRGRTSAAFQDFVRFELLVRETVGIGDLPRAGDDTAVREALVRASASDVLGALPSGLDTQLGRTFTGGVELSAGQWQKLALGRAMMRTQPLLLVLDEPTASLDATTEHALFERYAGAAREAGRGTGAITVLVSHRFSTVRMADLIAVVDRGGVAECGTHAELVARRGLYAELYELQANAYR